VEPNFVSIVLGAKYRCQPLSWGSASTIGQNSVYLERFIWYKSLIPCLGRFGRIGRFSTARRSTPSSELLRILSRCAIVLTPLPQLVMLSLLAVTAVLSAVAAEVNGPFAARSKQNRRVLHDPRFLRSTGERSFSYFHEHLDMLGGLNHYSYDVSIGDPYCLHRILRGRNIQRTPIDRWALS
jgi:hypothetical protein